MDGLGTANTVKNFRTDHLEDVAVGARIILKWVIRKWDGEAWTGSSSGKGQMEGASDCGKEPSGPIKWAEFPEQLRICELRKNSAPCS